MITRRRIPGTYMNAKIIRAAMTRYRRPATRACRWIEAMTVASVGRPDSANTTVLIGNPYDGKLIPVSGITG